jgi:predicted nucleic acid-binding protein
VSLVIDCSMTLSWSFEDERTPARIGVLNQVADAGAVVPALWRLEVLNELQVAVRRGRVTIPYRDVSLTDLRALSIAIDRGTNRQAWSGTLRLCDRFGLTPYDAAYLAAYLEVALRRRLPLATLDGDLARAAEAENVPLVGAA